MTSRYEHYAYVVLRFMAGAMWAMHGTRKLWGWPGERRPSTATLSIVGGWIEVIGGTLLAIGIFASWAAFIASGMMAVAYFMRHASDGFFPIVNGGELAVLYCFLWLYVASRDRGWKRGIDDNGSAAVSPGAGRQASGDPGVRTESSQP